MSDFDMLQALQIELFHTLKKRSELSGADVPKNLSKAKIRRLRLQIQEVMLRIERACDGFYIDKKGESWHS